MRLGVHVPIAGGLDKALGWAQRTGCTTMQIFSRSPRGGKSAPIDPTIAHAFTTQRHILGIEPLAIHAPYIINLASPEPEKWRWFIQHYREEYQRAEVLSAQYLVTHVGSHRGAGEAAGMQRVSEAIAQTLDGARASVMILLENTAGSGQGLGYDFDQLAIMRNGVRAKDRVGICLDTAHLFAAGYPIHTEKGLEETVASFDRIIGLEHLKLIHLNDSKVPFQSRVDRHWHIGEGHIGLEAFRRIVTHPGLRDIPFILETPKTSEREDRRNLNTVRALVGSRSPRRSAKRTAAA